MSVLDDARDLREQIQGCANCELRKGMLNPVPFSGPPRAELVVVGQAPGAQENEQGTPFVGPSGQRLKDILQTAGFNLPRVFFMNSTSCYARGEKGDLEPTVEQVKACSGNFKDQLTLAQAPYILLVGKVALRTVVPGVELARVHGRTLWWGRGVKLAGQVQWWCDAVWGLATYHPAAALRNPQYMKVLETDVGKLREGIVNGFKFTEACGKCSREDIVDWTDNGLGLCADHRTTQQAWC